LVERQNLVRGVQGGVFSSDKARAQEDLRDPSSTVAAIAVKAAGAIEIVTIGPNMEG
jgi:hypothetical protein